jgi:hypothetical protein
MPGARPSHELFIPSLRLQSFKVGTDIPKSKMEWLSSSHGGRVL